MCTIPKNPGADGDRRAECSRCETNPTALGLGRDAAASCGASFRNEPNGDDGSFRNEPKVKMGRVCGPIAAEVRFRNEPNR